VKASLRAFQQNLYFHHPRLPAVFQVKALDNLEPFGSMACSVGSEQFFLNFFIGLPLRN
jgi:hypothetical protein